MKIWNQYGRSMVEMLGVLAIIGVLSVGGIAGYSRAMFKYKLNKQTEQLNTIIRAIVLYKDKLTFDTEGKPITTQYSVWPQLIALNEIPPEMYYNDNYIQDIFKTKYNAYYHGHNFIALHSILTRSSMGTDICQSMLSVAREWHDEVSSVRVLKYGTEESAGGYLSNLAGDSECSRDKKCLKDITLDDMREACTVCESEDVCRLFFFWEHVKKR